ncbi:MAG: D-lactate dehydrogenase VanH-A [Thermomicrobiales bacterium]|nr:D-lactate dehydrogenase VanH-A [Thermomicrobiales bacterium]
MTVYGCGQHEAALFRQMAPRFGIRPTITDAALAHATVELALGTRCISVGHKERIPKAVLYALSQAGVRYISTRSIGYDHIDVGYARRLGMTVENVAYSPDSVADYTVMLMLMAVRHARSTLRRADMHDFRSSSVAGRELRDLTIGIVGTGRIGAAVIDRLRGFGGRIVAYDPCPNTTVEYVPLEVLVRQSDLISLHTPLDASTHHLLDRRHIEQMKSDAFVVNTARGALIDTEALVLALEQGRLGGAALDVLEGEEGVFYTDCRNSTIEHPLLLRLQRLPNVLITPHTAYYTDHAVRDIVENSLINCLEFLMRSQHG